MSEPKMSYIRLKLIDAINLSNSKTLLLENTLNISEIKSLIRGVFQYDNSTKIVGFEEMEKKNIGGNSNNNSINNIIVYPISMITVYFNQCHEKTFKVLLGYESFVSQIVGHRNLSLFRESADSDGKNILSSSLLSPSSSLCTTEMAEAAFYFLDLNGDDKIDRYDMVKSLTQALNHLEKEKDYDNDKNNSNNLIQEYSGDMKSLAVDITESCFKFLGLEEELYANLSDFTAWYLSVGDNIYREILIKAIEAYHNYLTKKSSPSILLNHIHKTSPTNDAINFGFSMNPKDDKTTDVDKLYDAINKIRYLLGLDHVTIKSMSNSFKSEALLSQVMHHELDATSHKIYIVTRTLFIRRLESLSSVTGRIHQHHHLNSSNNNNNNTQYDIQKVLLMLFNSFHPSGPNDSVPLTGVMSGLSLFYTQSSNTSQSNNTQDDSLRQLFRELIDIKDEKSRVFVSDRCLRDFLYQNIKIMYLLSLPLRHYTQTDAESFTIFIYGQVLKNMNREIFGLWNTLEFVKAAKYGIGLIFLFLKGDSKVKESYVPLQLINSNGIPISADLADSQGFDVVSPVILDHEGVMVSLIDAKSVLGLLSASPVTIFQLFKNQAVDSDGNISSSSYHHVLHKLLRHYYSTLSIVDRLFVDYIIEQIFQLFSTNPLDENRDHDINGHDNNGHDDDGNDSKNKVKLYLQENKCDILDITLALITLCGGPVKAKASCITEVFRYFGDDSYSEDETKDLVDDSPISMEYVAMCTEPIFVTIAGLNPKLSDRDFIGDLSYELTSYAFKTFFHSEEYISVEKFEIWFDVLFTFFDQEYGQSLLEKALNEIQSISGEEVTFNEVKNKLKLLHSEKISKKSQNSDITSNTTNGMIGDSLSLELNEEEKQVGDGVTLPTSTASVVSEIQEVSSMLGLDGFSADDILDTLGEYSYEGQLDMESWLEAVGYIMCLGNIPQGKYDEASYVANSIFHVFKKENHNNSGDRHNHHNNGNSNNNNNDKMETISFAQFTSGLTVLSNSPIEDRLNVSFALHDYDSDGYLTFEEFESLIGSHLSVIITVSKFSESKVNALGQSIDTLAVAVASECYAALGLEKSAKISLEQVCEVGNDCLVLAENVSI